MPVSNHNTKHVSAEDKLILLNMVGALKGKIMEICAGTNLAPSERTKFGRLRKKRIPFIRRVADYRKTSPELSAQHVNWTEFDADYADFDFFNNIERELLVALRPTRDRMILAGNDVYKSSLIDYNNTVNMAENSDMPGFSAKREDLKGYFPGSGEGEGEEEVDNGDLDDLDISDDEN